MCFFNINFEFHEDFFPKITKIEIWKVFGLNLERLSSRYGYEHFEIKKEFCNEL